MHWTPVAFNNYHIVFSHNDFVFSVHFSCFDTFLSGRWDCLVDAIVDELGGSTLIGSY